MCLFHVPQVLYATEPQSDYLFAALVTVFQVHKDAPPKYENTNLLNVLKLYIKCLIHLVHIYHKLLDTISANTS